MKASLSALFSDEGGQDLVEYALLTSFVGFACIGVFEFVMNGIALVYGTWNTAANNNWRPPDPQ